MKNVNSKFENYYNLLSLFLRLRGARGDPAETEKIAVEKWFYFPELYKMTEDQEDRIRNSLKINFSSGFLYENSKFFSNFKS